VSLNSVINLELR